MAARTETQMEISTETPAITALGSLFRITESFLWDNALADIAEVYSASPHFDNLDEEHIVQDARYPTAIISDVNARTTADIPSLEDIELAAQMSALGLPISFSTNKRHLQKKTLPTKGKRKGVGAKFLLDHMEIVPEKNVQVDVDTVSLDAEAARGNDLQYASIGLNHVEVDKSPGEDDNMVGLLIEDYSEEVKEVHMCRRTEHSLTSNSDGYTSWNHFNDFGDWCVVWDDFYMRNYFYNSKTQESTWDPPPGMEHLNGHEKTVSTDIKKVMDKNLCPILSLDIQDNIESLQNIVSQLGAEEVWRSELELTFTNSEINKFGLCEYSNEPEENVIADEVKKLLELPQFVFQNGNMGCEETWRSDTTVEALDGHQDIDIIKKKKKHKKQSRRKILPGENKESPLQEKLEGLTVDTIKYWCQRYLLFSRFDEGVKMDEEGWFSVTPELLARHHASRCGSGTIIDCFTGVGGNAIQFAKRSNHVIAIDIDSQKIDYARHNATIYGVDDNIDFVKGDFFYLAPKLRVVGESAKLRADTVFLSPPWGGPDYAKVQTYDIRTMLKPHDGYFLLKTARWIAPRIVMFLPRNVDLNQLANMALLVSPPLALEVEKNFLNGKLKAITAYFTETSM